MSKKHRQSEAVMVQKSARRGTNVMQKNEVYKQDLQKCMKTGNLEQRFAAFEVDHQYSEESQEALETPEVKLPKKLSRKAGAMLGKSPS